MILSVINRAPGKLTDAEIQTTIRAINRQIEGDFAPYWGFGAILRLEARRGKVGDRVNQAEMRGDAVLYILDHTTIAAAEGYHDRTFQGIPFGFVFLPVSHALNEDWRITFSHEALELIADPEANLLVQGPHPLHPRRKVYHWFEMCDAVQAESYSIDHVPVSNFVLPPFFTSGKAHGGRNDFLGARHKGATLRSFGVNPGGYIGFFDPKIGKDTSYFAAHDLEASHRLAIKRRNHSGRGNLRRRRTKQR